MALHPPPPPPALTSTYEVPKLYLTCFGMRLFRTVASVGVRERHVGKA